MGVDISKRDCAREKVCHRKIAQNRTGSIFWPNNDCWMRLCAKLDKERSWEGRDISVRDKLLEKGCHFGIARNRTGSIFRPNNDYWKRSPTKIIKGAIPGWLGYKRA